MSYNEDLRFQLALRQVPLVGDVIAKQLLHLFGNAKDVFDAKKSQLEKIEGIGSIKAANIKAFNDFNTIEKELEFAEKNNIQIISVLDKNYPQRLKICFDSPAILFMRGNANLNHEKIVSIVGTRNNSDYGKQMCEELIEGLTSIDALIVSGLAFGIDTIAHKSALKNNLKTIGVLAHGLDKIYPAQNLQLARDMTLNGGLLTDFVSGTKPDKQNFPSRNRIVAGICDVIVVVESGIKGGSLITAELANGYNKDILAYPGRANEPKSEGCNYLIKSNKANLITEVNDLFELMNWTSKPVEKKKQRDLFIELSNEEQTLFDVLKTKETMHIDELFGAVQLSSSAIAQGLLMLEMNGIIASKPGKIYAVL